MCEVIEPLMGVLLSHPLLSEAQERELQEAEIATCETLEEDSWVGGKGTARS